MLRTQDDRLLFFVIGGYGGRAARIDKETEWPYGSGYRSPVLYEMRLNVRTMPHTGVRVQILDGMAAHPISGYTWKEALPVSGDYLYACPRWRDRDDIAGLVDRPARVEIALRGCSRFGWIVICIMRVSRWRRCRESAFV